MKNKKKAEQEKDRAQLEVWQQRLQESNTYWQPQLVKMDERERLFNGERTLKPLVPGDEKEGIKKTSHVRNIILENIESQISSSIPQPKVTPRRKEDELLAAKIEHFIRNELDRMDFESNNDMAERTVPMQGGVGHCVEWDNTKRTHMTVGELSVDTIHPKQFAPQPGVYTGIEDMDWFVLKLPTTKKAVLQKYGIPVFNESEQEPQIRGAGDEDTAPDAVTMYVGYEKGEGGGINKFVWVADKCLENLTNYQARRCPVCARCGKVRPLPGQVIHTELELPQPSPVAVSEAQLNRDMAGHAMAGMLAQAAAEGQEHLISQIQYKPEEKKYEGGACPWCGSEDFIQQEQEYELVYLPIKTAAGTQIPGAEAGLDENGSPVFRPVQIPFYKPDVYPIVLQKNVSQYGQLLGTSDVDAIADQQNTINRLEQKIIDRIMKAGTRITLPARADMQIDPKDGEVWYLEKPSDKSMIDVYSFSGELGYELNYLAQVYEEARQILGITDSFQGRRDPTATSGVAKEYSAAQAAGRLESKRVMKNAAYAKIFELMFKFAIAYSDEPRTVSYKDAQGQTQYEEFSRYDFLEQDAEGNWFWNDQFLFSCDTSAPLSSNREAMWQETRMNLQTGAFGDPASTATLILFWGKMEQLHYPGAGETKKVLEQRQKQEMQLQAQQMLQQVAMQQPNMQAASGGGMPGQLG